MTAQTALLSLTFVVLALLIWQLRWVLLVLFGAVVVAVALDVLIHQLQDRSRLVRPQALLVVPARLRLAGLVTMRQRPGTASGTVFLTVEDDIHALNVIIWPKLTETYREALLRSQILGVVGHVQREQSVVHFIADSLFNLNGFLRHLDSACLLYTSPSPRD